MPPRDDAASRCAMNPNVPLAIENDQIATIHGGDEKWLSKMNQYIMNTYAENARYCNIPLTEIIAIPSHLAVPALSSSPTPKPKTARLGNSANESVKLPQTARMIPSKKSPQSLSTSNQMPANAPPNLFAIANGIPAITPISSSVSISRPLPTNSVVLVAVHTTSEARYP
jgi:hypothetical protein